jgi:sugar lactone lactonase YvrE
VGKEIDLIAEGIACSSGDGHIFLSSYHKRKLIEFNPRTGKVVDFLSNGEYGYQQGTGLEIRGNLLFALSTAKRMGKATSRLQVFDKASRELLHEYTTPEDQGGFWNDLAVGSENTIYITDTQNNLVWRLAYPNGQPEIFLTHIEIRFPNGIALSGDERKLFVASWSHGIRIIDVTTGKVLNTNHPATTSVGIDGLKYYKGNLYAIRNGARAKQEHALLRIALNDMETRLEKIDTVLIDHPAMNIPTTFCLTGKQAYILANSQLDMLDQQENRIIHHDSLTPTYLIKLKI